MLDCMSTLFYWRWKCCLLNTLRYCINVILPGLLCKRCYLPNVTLVCLGLSFCSMLQVVSKNVKASWWWCGYILGWCWWVSISCFLDSRRERRLRGRRWHQPLQWPRSMRSRKWWTPFSRRGLRTLALVSEFEASRCAQIVAKLLHRPLRWVLYPSCSSVQVHMM